MFEAELLKFLYALLQLDLPVGRRFRRGNRPDRLRPLDDGVALARDSVCVLNGAQAGGYSRFAGCNGLAVAPTLGAFGHGLAIALDLANVGFAFVGVSGDGEDDCAGGGAVEAESVKSNETSGCLRGLW